MNPQIMNLSERSQTERKIYCIIPFYCGRNGCHSEVERILTAKGPEETFWCDGSALHPNYCTLMISQCKFCLHKGWMPSPWKSNYLYVNKLIMKYVPLFQINFKYIELVKIYYVNLG